MTSHITGLSHVVIAARDLAEASETFRRLGFTLSGPRLTLAQAYMELRHMPDAREGLLGLGLASTDPEADLARLGGELPQLGFPLWLGSPSAQTEAEHANTAQGIISVTALGADPVGLMGEWDRLIGPARSTATDETVTVHTGRGLVFLCRPEDLDQLHPEAEDEPSPLPPALVALTITVADPETAAAVLRGNGIAYSRDPNGNLRIAASDCHGVFMELVAQ